METSDSEYFESADEDFESDCEEREKHHQSVRQIFTHKIIEPELSKLKMDERQENNSKTTQNILDNRANDSKIIAQKKIALEESKSMSVNDKTKFLASNDAIIVEQNLDETKECVNTLVLDSHQKEAVEEKLICNLEKYADNLEYIKNSVKEPIRTPCASVSLLRTLDIDTTNSANKNETPIDPETEETLWDDDEIDWGSEAAKEESQKTEQSPVSKDEDSGWDDFDAEWESESHSASNQTVVKSTGEKKTRSQSSITEKLWDDDGWVSLENPEEKSKENEFSWGTWGGWGVSSLLNSATQGVSSLTTQVSHGLSTVLESSMGIPDPEEMARINKLRVEKDDANETDNEPQDPVDNTSMTPVAFGLGNLVSGVSQLTKFVESTGTKVITGGLDTLEAIGKKTVEVLQEGDPGLKKKRAFLKLDTGKPNLSHVLREAKERAEEENQELARRHVKVKRVKNYEALFDDHQGLVHLEALEMLSKLCTIKLDNLNNSLSGEALSDMHETLDQVKELCELPEDEEEAKVSIEDAKETICNAVKEISIPICYDKLFVVCEKTNAWLENVNMNFIDDIELHQQAIDSLAQLTALAVEQFHKTGELLLVKDHRSTADEADSLVQITTTVKSLILGEAGKFTDKLSTIKNLDKDKINEHITNIFYESANSGTYIQDAFHLLIPILQVGAV